MEWDQPVFAGTKLGRKNLRFPKGRYVHAPDNWTPYVYALCRRVPTWHKVRLVTAAVTCPSCLAIQKVGG